MKTLVVQLDAVSVVTDQKFVEFFRRSAFEGGKELKQRKIRGLVVEEAFGQFGATGEAVRQIQRFGDHDARIAVGPVSWRGTLVGHTYTKFEGRQIIRGGAIVVSAAHLQNLARQNTGFGHGTREGLSRFRLKNGQHDGVALNEHFFRGVTVQ